jgi:3-oxochol-4-en-24-oyl-CoA dehydrogenase
MTQEQQALQASLRDWAKRAGTIAAIRAIRKLLGTAHRQEAAESALEHLGPAGAAETEASQEFLLTRCLFIAGGTTQILLTQVAERVLGLPR